MGNCNDKDVGSKPSKPKHQDNTPKSNLVIATFGGSNFGDTCLTDHQPPTFSDPNFFGDSKVDISAEGSHISKN